MSLFSNERERERMDIDLGVVEMVCEELGKKTVIKIYKINFQLKILRKNKNVKK